MDLVADSKSRSETAPLPPPVPGSRRHRILTSVVVRTCTCIERFIFPLDILGSGFG